jgi:uncharacterized RDD family membrane protein YckC
MVPQPEPNTFASVGRRLVAGLIDAVLMVVGFVVILFLVAFFMGVAGADEQTMQSDLLFWITFGLWVVFGWMYSALLEGSSVQATLGKLALQIQVADASGRRISFVRATLRFGAKAVFTPLTLSIAFFVAAFSERHQALYDIIAGTIVVPRGAHVVVAAETPLGMADPTAVEILRSRAAVSSEPKSPMSAKRYDRALAALARVAEPGERPIAAANALIGPSPFVVHLLLGSLGRFLLLKSGLLWITDRRVVLIRLSNWNGRPHGLIFAEPRSSVVLFRAESRTLWLRRVDGTEYRLNQIRKSEASWIRQALGGPLV